MWLRILSKKPIRRLKINPISVPFQKPGHGDDGHNLLGIIADNRLAAEFLINFLRLPQRLFSCGSIFSHISPFAAFLRGFLSGRRSLNRTPIAAGNGPADIHRLFTILANYVK